MNSFIVRRGKSLVQGLKGRHAWWLMGAGALALASLLFGSLALGSPSVQAGAPTETPTVEAPTATPPPGSTIFVGSIEEVSATCGGGSITLVVNPEGTGITSVGVVEFQVLTTSATETFEFDPPIAIEEDGSFSQSGPLPGDLAAINSAIVGTFDFSADPATVAGTLTISLVADPSNVLCEADFTAEALAAGAPTPTVPAPAATEEPTATAAATALPATGSSSTAGSGGDTMLWTALAAIAGVAALSAAGAAVLRRRA